MKLYELNRGDLFELKEPPQIPPDSATPYNENQTFKLVNIDGMYSYTVCQQDFLVYHFAAWTEVEKI